MSLKNQGITLIEVMVTLAITTTGLLGISALQLQSNRANQDSGNRSQAVWMLEDLANRINANSTSWQNYDTSGIYSCPSSPPPRCADHYSAGSKTIATACTSTQVAAFDLWDVACPHNETISVNGKTVKIRQSYADFISNPKLSVTTSAINNQATISLTWDARTSGTDGNGNTQFIIDESSSNRSVTLTRQVQL